MYLESVAAWFLKCANNHGRAVAVCITVFHFFCNNGKRVCRIWFRFTGETKEESDTFAWEHANTESAEGAKSFLWAFPYLQYLQSPKEAIGLWLLLADRLFYQLKATVYLRPVRLQQNLQNYCIKRWSGAGDTSGTVGARWPLSQIPVQMLPANGLTYLPFIHPLFPSVFFCDHIRVLVSVFMSDRRTCFLKSCVCILYSSTTINKPWLCVCVCKHSVYGPFSVPYLQVYTKGNLTVSFHTYEFCP